MGDFIRGNGNEVRVGATAAPRIQPGQLLSLVSGTQVSGVLRATPVGAWTWDTSLAQSQANFKRTFVGVSVDAKASGTLSDVMVATTGVYRFPVAALGSGFDVGSLFGPAQDGANSALSATALAPCASGLGIAQLVQPAFLNDTTVVVNIAGDLTTAGRGVRSE